VLFLRGSTDVGDVSWCCPTAKIVTACAIFETPGHSWQNCAQAGMGIGHAEMLAVAKVLAGAGYMFMTEPERLARAKADSPRLTGGKKYKSAMPSLGRSRRSIS
jgi:aminobenzoyl-glutamate utilization protein B